MPKHIFMSYRSKEAKIAIRVANDLMRDGYAVWMDQLGGLQVGDDWAKKIEDAIGESVAMVCMMSPEYIGSRWCMAELQRGLSHPQKISVFPIKIFPVQQPFGTEQIHWLDLTDTAVYQQKYAELKKALADKHIHTDEPNLSFVVGKGILAPYRDDNEQSALLKKMEAIQEEYQKEIAHFNTVIELVQQDIQREQGKLSGSMQVLAYQKELEEYIERRNILQKKLDGLYQTQPQVPPDNALGQLAHIRKVCSEHFYMIDFHEILGQFTTLKSKLMQDGGVGAVPLLTQNSKHLGHSYFIQRIQREYQGEEWDVQNRILKFDTVSIDDFHRKLADLFGRDKPSLDILIDKLVASLAGNTVCLVEMVIEEDVSSSFMDWFMTDFWAKLCQRLQSCAIESHILWFLFIHDSAPDESDVHCCPIDDVEEAVIRQFIPIHLQHWTEKHIKQWLNHRRFEAYAIPSEVKEKVAKRLVRKHDGKPTYICQDMLNILEERLTEHYNNTYETGREARV